MAPNSELTNKAPENTYRYERKFSVPELSFQEIDQLIKFHPAIFKELYYPRYINNIYFDTCSKKSYQDNVIGLSERAKFRVRWYGDLFGELKEPTLEIKKKSSFLNTKEQLRLNNFTFTPEITRYEIKNLILSNDIPKPIMLHMMDLEPILLNRYSRNYYLSVDKKFRLTLDKNLSFYSLEARSCVSKENKMDENHCIVELKYECKNEKDVSEISKYFPFRLTRSSKFISGLDHIWA